ncbi:UbiA prenyltransferase family [Aspergillus pseudocaelatus]|uniref:UbiA prenyltransferase family n=1 Tax=Aspergillus pseudocaelatus TaxID=1825620 RepID=A0ABQ6VZB3_9EURO|nr:UbiA prenyltransferase family [Aspergillus pseudocaelatus]
MFLWLWSNLFLFTLHNQRSASAISEGKINKPWRPLSAGRISSRQVRMLIYCMYLAIFTVSGTKGGAAPCILEAFSCLWYNEWNGASNPLLKNLLNGVGFACFFAGPLEVATDNSVLSGDMKAFMLLLVLAGAIMTTVHAQDFRDIEGDRVSGRKTVPLLIGDQKARSALAVGIIGWTALSCWFWDLGSAERPWLSCIPACVAGTIVVWGFYWNKTREGDRRSTLVIIMGKSS